MAAWASKIQDSMHQPHSCRAKEQTMEREDRSQQICRYVENMQRLRLLSTPDVSEIDDADDYGRILIDNFS